MVALLVAFFATSSLAQEQSCGSLTPRQCGNVATVQENWNLHFGEYATIDSFESELEDTDLQPLELFNESSQSPMAIILDNGSVAIIPVSQAISLFGSEAIISQIQTAERLSGQISRVVRLNWSSDDGEFSTLVFLSDEPPYIFGSLINSVYIETIEECREVSVYFLNLVKRGEISFGTKAFMDGIKWTCSVETNDKWMWFGNPTLEIGEIQYNSVRNLCWYEYEYAFYGRSPKITISRRGFGAGADVPSSVLNSGIGMCELNKK